LNGFDTKDLKATDLTRLARGEIPIGAWIAEWRRNPNNAHLL